MVVATRPARRRIRTSRGAPRGAGSERGPALCCERGQQDRLDGEGRLGVLSDSNLAPERLLGHLQPVSGRTPRGRGYEVACPVGGTDRRRSAAGGHGGKVTEGL